LDGAANIGNKSGETASENSTLAVCAQSNFAATGELKKGTEVPFAVR
jgi:hypothetical protein